jgi:hypothetical protein
VTSSALEAVDRILNRGGDPQHVLRAVVGTLVERGECAWAAVHLAGHSGSVAGPEAGEERRDARTAVPIVFGGERLGELLVDGCDDNALVERVALLVAPHCRFGATTPVSPVEEVS